MNTCAIRVVTAGVFLSTAYGLAAAEQPDINPASTADITLALSKLAIETKADDFSDNAYRAAKAAVLDALGCAIAGRDAPGVTSVLKLTREWGGKPEATVWFQGVKVPGPEAVFANSTQTHALDLDDVHTPSITHLTSLIVPVALAMGEANEASGRETLAAVILGIEVAGRLGRVCGSRGSSQHFLPTTLYGGFGATAAACRLQGCSVEQTVHAMGVWYAHCSGNRQALYERTLTKRIQPAIAARAGTFASYLSRQGFTGPRDVIGGTGNASLTQIYGFRAAGKPPTVGEVMTPRPFFEVEQLSYKRFACCGASHRALDAALSLVSEHDLKIGDVETVWIFGVGVDAKTSMTGIPWRDDPCPHVLAQFCAPYEVASVIKNRRFGPAEITNERIAEDREVDALARRIKLCDWKAWGEAKPPNAHQGIRIFLKDGRTFDAWRSKSDTIHPQAFTYAELVGKFKENAVFSRLVDETGASEMVKAIESLDQCSHVGDFIERHLLFKK